MNIIPSKQETFDAFLLNASEIHKEAIEEFLRKQDESIYRSVDREQFVLVRMDERTILSSYGAIRFKRRYCYDAYSGECRHLLDNLFQIPKSQRMTNELVPKILDLASVMTYKEVGEHLSDEFTLSKSTVWKTMHETLLEPISEGRSRRWKKPYATIWMPGK